MIPRWPRAALAELGPGAVQSALGSPLSPTVEEADLLAADAPSHHLALASRALARGLARRLPTRPMIRTTGNRLVVIPERSGEPAHYPRVRTCLREAYGEPLVGQLPPTLGVNEAGERRAFAEGISLRIERWLGYSWLLFTPFTWVEATAEMARAARDRAPDRPLDPAAQWNAERWAQRRFNEKWAAILAAWADAAAPRHANRVHILSRQHAALPGAVGGAFELGSTTAYSHHVA